MQMRDLEFVGELEWRCSWKWPGSLMGSLVGYAGSWPRYIAYFAPVPEGEQMSGYGFRSLVAGRNDEFIRAWQQRETASSE